MFNKVYKVNTDSQWLRTTKEFYRWKKTDDYKHWSKKQFLKQGGLCYYCQDFLPMTRQHVEHKLARSRGGGNNKSNLVISCANCNKDKGSRLLTQAEREKYNKQNKNLKGTYLKNKQHFNNLYGEYSDEAIYERIKNL